MRAQHVRVILTVLVGLLIVAAGVEAIRQQTGPWLWVACSSGAFLILAGWTAFHARTSSKPTNWQSRLLEASIWFGATFLVAVALNGSVESALVLGPLGGSGVLWALMIAALVTAILALIRVLPGHAGLKIIPGVLGLYATASLAFLLIGNATVDTAKGGEALLGVLPVWLQGPAISLVLIAVASVFLLIRSLGKSGETSWLDAVSMLAVGLCCAAILVVARPEGTTSASGASDSLATASEDGSLPELATHRDSVLNVGEAMTGMYEIANEYGPDDYDIETLADRLGDDPDSAFIYVRDQIALEPYSGVLRGADGALSAHAGNSFDRALLLKAILDEQGHTTRLAAGRLDDDAISQLHTHTLSREPQDSADEPILALGGIVESARDRFTARVARDEQWLRSILGRQISRERLQGEARFDADRHVWVQMETEGEWRDLDTSLPDLEAGSTLASLTDTFDQPSATDSHRVVIRVHAESLSPEGALSTFTLLQHELGADVASRSHVYLAFAPEQASRGLGGIVSASVLRETAYHPVLMVGDETLEGEQIPSVASTSADSSSSMTAQDFFFGGGSDETAPRLAALHLEVEVLSPGSEPQTSSRPLLDRLTPTQRQQTSITLENLASLEETAGMPTPFAAVHQLMVSTGGANPFQRALGMIAALDFASQNMQTPEAATSLSIQEALWPLAESNSQLAMASERLAIPMLNDLEGARFFVDAPRVFIASIQPQPDSSEHHIGLEIDLMHDGVGWLASETAEPREISDRLLRYGVAQSALETTFLELRAASLAGDLSRVHSASTEFASGWELLGTSDLQQVDAPAALLEDAEEGLSIIMPDSDHNATSDVWWAYDASTGTIAARLAPGLGGGNYVNGSTGGPRYILDERTGRTLGEVRNGVDRYYRNGSPKGSCRGGNEYTTILGCVSIPTSTATGIMVAVVVAIYAIIAAELIYYLS